ncbi:MAG: type II secretion system minor pseudopilin GspK [Cocleimonas sp.]
MFKATQKKGHQDGVALITALIITSIAVSLATMIMYRQQIQIRLSSNISHLEQAYLYANGMEDWAATILERSFKDHKDYVSHDDDWYSDTALILPIEGGLMTGKLIDLQSRINMNLLNIPPPAKTTNNQNTPNSTNNQGDGTNNQAGGTNNENNNPKIQPDYAKITRNRLIRLVEDIDEDRDLDSADGFVDILKDWIDKDDINGNLLEKGDGSGYGAETSYYQSLDPAYYSANTELVSPTELRLLKNMKEKIYQELIKYVATLPNKRSNKDNPVPINVNTASAEVLRAIGFAKDTIERIQEARKDNPFIDIKDFIRRYAPNAIGSENNTNANNNSGNNNPNLNSPNNNTNELNVQNLGVNSNYFLLTGTVEINNARLFVNSILERNNEQVSVIMRDLSNPNTITKVKK